MSGKPVEQKTTARDTGNLGIKILIFIGKPFFLVIFLVLLFIFKLVKFPLFFSNLITEHYSRIKQKVRLKDKGNIFSGKWINFKIFVFSAGKKFSSFLTGYKNFVWRVQVFIIAFQKLYGKISPQLRLKFQKKRIISLTAFKFKAPVLPKFGFTKLLVITFSAIFFLSFLSGIIFWQLVLKDLPSPTQLTNRNYNISTKIYDRNRELLYTIYKDKKRTPVPLDQIPQQVRLATITAEDQDFYTHPGFSLRGIARAIFKDLREGRITGGSTITQQLVKNALLTPERTILRKLKEITLAIEVERTYSKDKILEMYLNEVPYGGTAYGIQEAANTFFDKDVSQLTLGESALLAGLPQSPTKYSPYGANPENSFSRQKEILSRMLAKGFINAEQKSAAEAENITFSKSKASIKAPHFVFYVRDLLEEKYGKSVVEQGGLEVTTTLDYRIQKLVEEVVNQEIDKLKNLNVGNAAVIVMDPQTGEILSMVGSKDFFDTANGGNVNVTTRPRQPGSSIKVVNYAYALSNGLTAATIIPDTPTTFEVEGQPPYSPKNYEGGYRGNLTLRSALAESRNIPAVKVLASYGIDYMLDMGKKMGITTWTDPKNYGLSLTLGGGEVKLIDLARVFATISNYGIRPEITSILKVTDYQGSLVAEFKCNDRIEIPKVAEASTAAIIDDQERRKDCGGNQIIDPRVAFILTDILKDNNARAPSFGTNSLLVIKNHPEVAVKTGTSNDLRDNLAIGYNQKYVVAVWIGNNDNSPMSRIASGVTGATPIYNKIMTALLANEPSSEWTVPEGLTKLPVCPLTGTLACEGCPVKMEWFLEENKPDKACSKDFFANENTGVSPSISPYPGQSTNKYFENILRDQIKKIRKKT